MLLRESKRLTCVRLTAVRRASSISGSSHVASGSTNRCRYCRQMSKKKKEKKKEVVEVERPESLEKVETHYGKQSSRLMMTVGEWNKNL